MVLVVLEKSRRKMKDIEVARGENQKERYMYKREGKGFYVEQLEKVGWGKLLSTAEREAFGRHV